MERTKRHLRLSHRPIRSGKGNKDRVVTLPDAIIEPLRRHLNDRLTTFERDRAAGVGTVYLPGGLGRKYPKAAGEWVGSMFFLHGM